MRVTPRPLSRRELLFLGMLLLLGLAVRAYRIQAPFAVMFENEATEFGREFRCLHRYGFHDTGGWSVETRGPWKAPGNARFHLTHWPVSLWLNVLFQKAVGIGANPMPEWSVRAVSVLAAALTPLLLFLIVRRLADPLRAALAAAVATLLPATIYFSQAVCFHFPLTFLLVFLALLAYFRWRERPGTARMALFLLATAAALGSIYEAFYLLPTLLLFHGLSREPRRGRFLLTLAAWGLFVGAALLFVADHLPNSPGLMSRIAYRTQPQSPGAIAGKFLVRLLLYHTPVVATAAGLWAWRLCRGRLGSWRGPWNLWILLWLAWGLYDLAFPTFWIDHAYAIYPLFVFLSCASAEIAAGLWQARPRAALALGLLFLCCAGLSAAFLHRVYLRPGTFPMTEALAQSVRRRMKPEESLITPLQVEPTYVEFYLDGMLVRDIHSLKVVETLRSQAPWKHFRYLVVATPQDLEAWSHRPQDSPKDWDKLFDALGFAASHALSKPMDLDKEHPEDAGFRRELDLRYAKVLDPPFTYYDLDRPR